MRAGQVKEVYLMSERPFHNYGNHVRIQHDDGFETTYAHLQEARVVPGQELGAGDLVGLADSTGKLVCRTLAPYAQEKRSDPSRSNSFPERYY